MSDVLLATSFFLKNDPKQIEKMRPYAPLGTLYAAASLRNRGYSVAVFDAMLSEAGVGLDLDLPQHEATDRQCGGRDDRDHHQVELGGDPPSHSEKTHTHHLYRWSAPRTTSSASSIRMWAMALRLRT